MLEIAEQRCFNHAGREAAARCPRCRRFFCRECVTEHEDRVLCAECLRTGTGRRTTARRSLRVLGRATQFVAAVAVLWLFFLLLGRGLMALPSSFHDSAFMQRNWQDAP